MSEELPDPDRLNEDEPAPDVNEDDNLEVVPDDVKTKAFAAYYVSNYAEPTHA